MVRTSPVPEEYKLGKVRNDVKLYSSKVTKPHIFSCQQGKPITTKAELQYPPMLSSHNNPRARQSTMQFNLYFLIKYLFLLLSCAVHGESTLTAPSGLSLASIRPDHYLYSQRCRVRNHVELWNRIAIVRKDSKLRVLSSE